MKTVAVICEYNPFHKGHAEHVRKIRCDFGEDTAVIAIMGSNYTQRGDIAIADCSLRAKAAVCSGIQLVLKLPFPFSCSSAQHFATAGVSIADRLGVVDALSFGSECGDLQELSHVAARLSSPAYTQAINRCDQSIGYAKYAQMLYRDLFGEEHEEVLKNPNDTLAVEYLQALTRLHSCIFPHAVLREGAAHDAAELSCEMLPSASAIRASWLSNSKVREQTKLFTFLPPQSATVFDEEWKNGGLPMDQHRLSSVVLAFLRNTWPSLHTEQLAEDGAGLYNRIRKQALYATSIEDLIQRTRTKKFTNARIRRLIWYALFGVTSSDLCVPPMYAQILAMDEIGLSLLQKIKKNGKIELLAKPADYQRMSPLAAAQAELDLRAEELSSFAKPVAEAGGNSFRHTPYRKNAK